jgi:hypothetical protein
VLRFPGRCGLETHDAFEIVEGPQHLREWDPSMDAFVPVGPIHRSDDQVVVADSFGGALREQACKQILKDVFVSQEQVARWAILACLVEREEVVRLDMNDQRQLALSHLRAALWARGEAQVGIGVEKEAITGWQLSEMGHGDAALLSVWT